MSFNPTRIAQSANRSNQTRTPGPGAGRTHAQIMAKQNVTRTPIGPRTQTRHGYTELAFEGKEFIARRESMHAGNSIGYGLNPGGDRMVFVESGMVFGFLADELGDVQTIKMGPGHVLRAPRGVKHGYATSGVDGADVLVVESVDYDKGWKQLQSATETARAAPNGAAPIATTLAPRDRSLDAATKAQAEEVAAVRGRRRAKVDGPATDINPNSTNSIGVNPKPMGPPVE